MRIILVLVCALLLLAASQWPAIATAGCVNYSMIQLNSSHDGQDVLGQIPMVCRRLLALPRGDAHVAYRAMGRLYDHSGRLEEAVKTYSVVIENNPSEKFPRLYLGLALFKLNRDEEALSYLSPIPGIEHYFVSVGKTWLKEGEAEAAIRNFSIAVKLNPSSARAYFGFGEAYGLLSQVREAAYAYEQAAKLASTSQQETLFRQEAHFRAGNYAWVHLGDVDSAVSHFKLAVDLTQGLPVQHRNLVYLAKALRGAGDLSSAYSTYHTAVIRFPNSCVALDGLGAVARLQGDFETAVRYGQKAVTCEPDNANNRLQLALSYIALGQAREAADVLRPAFERDPSLVGYPVVWGRDHTSTGEMDQAIYAYCVALFFDATRERAQEELEALRTQGYQVGCLP